jgi:hypothetical protein
LAFRRARTVLGLAVLVIFAAHPHGNAGDGSLRQRSIRSAGAIAASISAGAFEMTRNRPVMAGLLATGVAGGAAAQFNAEFIAWGDGSYGQRSIPTDAQLVRVALGNLHSIGLTADGRVVAWGSNASGQCDVPAGMTEVIEIAGGGWYFPTDQRGHSAALLRDGTVRAWGSNQYGQCNVPPTLSAVTQIACGWAHTAALTQDGTVVVWGAGDPGSADPHYGQRLVPQDLGAVSRISTKGCHMMALLADGQVRCWGRDAETQCQVPAKLGSVVEIAAGSDHSVALLSSGTVRCWGWNYHQQSSVPTDLGVVRAIAASLYGTLAVLEDGTVRSWGLIDSPPSSVVGTEAVVAGGYHAVAMAPRDCDGNLVPDRIDIETTRDFDTDGDGLPDACDGGDSLPVLHDLIVTRGTRGPLPWPLCGAWDTRTQQSDYLWDAWVSRVGPEGPWINRTNVPSGNPFRLGAVLALGSNRLTCRMDSNGCLDGTFTANLWLDTSDAPGISATNAQPIAAYGGRVPGLTPGTSVDASGVLGVRTGPWIVSVTAFSVEPANDLVGPIAFEGSGTSDLVATIEVLVLRVCGGDVTGNGVVDGTDLAAVLGAWGTDGSGQFATDIDGDGIVSGADLAQVLSAWGPCQ